MTVNFKYALDLNKDIKANDQEIEFVEKNGQGFLFESVLNMIVTKKYKDGVVGPTLRTLNNVYRKLDLDKTGSIELESSEVDLLKDLFIMTETAVVPQQVRIYSIYQQRVEDTIMASKPA